MEERKDIDKLLNSMDLVELYSLYSESKFKQLYTKDISFFSHEEVLKLEEKTFHWGVGDYKKVKNKVNGIYHKRTRIKKDIVELIKKPCIFATFTFNDYYIDNPNKRRYVNEFLRFLQCNYLGNVDYGAKNGRLHYHVIIQKESIDATQWKYGALNVKKIVVSNENAMKKYLVKLTCHSIKESTKNKERILKCIKFV